MQLYTNTISMSILFKHINNINKRKAFKIIFISQKHKEPTKFGLVLSFCNTYSTRGLPFSY